MKYIVIISVILFALFDQTMGQCNLCEYEADLIQNGDFEQGNTDFSTTLNFVTGLFNCPLCPENTYTIGANAILYHSGFFGSDHTNPPFGDFFIANALGQSNTPVWCQTMQVQPFTTYNFSFWHRDVNNNSDPHPLAWLQLSWNEVLQQDTIIAEGGWQQYTTSWNSLSATSLELCLINQQWQTGGNDFGLDDISLTACQNYQLSQEAFAGNDLQICSNETITLGQPQLTGFNYNWSADAGLSSNSIASPQITISNSSNEIIELEFILTTDSAGVGCITTDTVHISVLSVPEFQILGATSVCPSETAMLDAGTQWDQVLWNTGSSETQIEVGAGIFIAEVQYGICTSTDEIQIMEIAMPIIELGDDISICNNSLPLTLNAGVIVGWNTGAESQQIEVNASGNYNCTYSASGCEVGDEIDIAVFEMPIISLTPDTFFCENSSITLQSSTDGFWSTGESGNSIVVSTSGIFSLTATNGPCESFAAASVEMILLPDVYLGEDKSVCEDQQLELSAYSSQNIDYLWSNDSITSMITILGAGTYSVAVSNVCGQATDSIIVDTYPCGWQLFVPNSFSPNNDGLNDSWAVVGYNISNPEIRIYNRLGDLVFMTKELGVEWQPDLSIGQDVYNYRIEAIDYSGNHIKRTGHIYLLR